MSADPANAGSTQRARRWTYGDQGLSAEGTTRLRHHSDNDQFRRSAVEYSGAQFNYSDEHYDKCYV